MSAPAHTIVTAPVRTRRRWRRRVLVLAVVVALLPVPWRYASGSELGLAWRMDRRLVVDGQRLDPPGRWSWLTAGRPALVAELAWERLARLWRGEGAASARDLREGGLVHRPMAAEPLAAAVGLAAAGVHAPPRMRIAVAGPEQDGLPGHARIVRVNDHLIGTRADLDAQLAASAWSGLLSVTTAGGDRHTVPGHRLPYRSVELIDEVAGVRAAIGGHGPPYSWLRRLSLGSSHGLMVGLVTYSSASGEDLAEGRHIAGTGQLHADGTVGRIGGLRAKAGGALRAGADVLVVPADQVGELADVELGGMLVLGVDSLDDAIAQLRATAPGGTGVVQADATVGVAP